MNNVKNQTIHSLHVVAQIQVFGETLKKRITIPISAKDVKPDVIQRIAEKALPEEKSNG